MTTKDKKQLIILVLGIVALALLLINQTSGRQRRGGVSAMMPMQNINMPGEPGGREELKSAEDIIVPPAEIKYTGRDNRDPSDNTAIVRGLTAQEGPAPEVQFPKERFAVSAVIWGSRRPQAIINGKVTNIGEKLEGWEITSIDKKGIHVTNDGKEALLSIK